MELAEQVKIKAREFGAAEAGICSTLILAQNKESIGKMLPFSQSAVCLLVPHSEAAMKSPDIYLKQYDTIYCYDQVALISHKLVRFLESEGYQAVAVPAFLPLDMSDARMGMIGAVDWKLAAVESGLAVWGKSGLAVNPRFGPRVRLGGLITTAELRPDKKLSLSPCENCQLCIQSCPVNALSGNGGIDKKRCGEYIFSYGLRTFTRLLRDVAAARDEEHARELLYTPRTREIWQALETGNYYYCWTCQSCCPVKSPGH